MAVFGNPRPECLALFLACCRLGALYLGLNPKYTLRELRFICEDAKPRVVFAVQDSSLPAVSTRPFANSSPVSCRRTS